MTSDLPSGLCWVAFDLDDTLHYFTRASGRASEAVFREIEQESGIEVDELDRPYRGILRSAQRSHFSEFRSGPGPQLDRIRPNQVEAARARFAGRHGKSDRFDAYVLAELARTDAHRFRALVPDGEETKALRALTRAREDLVGVRVELANQLRAQLQAFWPGTLIFAEVDSPISLAFIKRYPSPVDAKGLGAGRMGAFLTREGYSGRTDPAELVARMRSAAQGTAGPAQQEARRVVVLGLVSALRPIVAEIAALTPRSASGSPPTPTRRSSGHCFAIPRRRSPRQSPSSATAGGAT